MPVQHEKLGELTNPTIPGERHRATYRSAVLAILCPETRPVYSRGSRFYNVDRWTARCLVASMCQWAKDNPGCTPTKDTVREWVREANETKVQQPHIVIANTPGKLRLRVASALIGGAYHEAFHTLYSCRRPLNVEEIAPMILSRWARIPDWSAVYRMIQDWSNIIEDIRIERRGREQFPGVGVGLHDLQDFVLRQEADGVEEIRSHGGAGKRGAMSILAGTFRDVGLGYSTALQHEVIAKYRQENSEAVEMVLSGPLRPLLDESIALDRRDDLGCLRIALSVVVTLVQNSQTQKWLEDQQQAEAEAAKRPRRCPDCSAPGHKMIVRPVSDGKGGKVKGKGICTCTVCGFQEEVQVKGQKDKSPKAPPPKDKGPKFVGFEGDDIDCGTDENDEDGQKGQKQASSKGKDPQGAKDEKDTDDGSSGGKYADGQDGGQGREGEASAGGQEATEGGEGEEAADGEAGDGGEGLAGEGDSSATRDYGQGNPNQRPEKGKVSDEWKDGGESLPEGHGASRGAGGLNPQIAGNDWTKVAADAVEDVKDGQSLRDMGLLDNNYALEGGVARDQKDEDGPVLPGEQAYRPYNPDLDDVMFVKESAKGLTHDKEQAQKLLDSVKDECSFLRARLAQIVRALEMTDTVHGLPRGRDLSQQYLVDSALSVRAGHMPERAYFMRDERIDLSMSAAVVIDESSSMSSILGDCTRILIAITEPLDRLGIPVQVSGFRDGRYARRPYADPNAQLDTGDYHRFGGITHDVFKQFGEKFQNVYWRFANTRATGSTPMADGIQFGLMALNYRNEGHRILFIITDGCPTDGEDVIPWQLRKAKEAGIHVIGVGIGAGAIFVKDLFPDHIWAGNVAEIPRLLVAKLNEIIDIRAIRRGGRMAVGMKLPTTR